ncbi:NAD-dependent epimerase/dehydratase family protein [Rhodobacteraceae bacterium NNCM2]|nr:NAD-dependent epimerase/dehydratase family protein [Coraliihabitans acroporae]
MRVLIIGGGGFLGQKIARSLAATGTLRGKAITQLGLADLVMPAGVDAPFPVTAAQVDITDAAQTSALIGQGWDVIFHLAAILSGQSESEFDLGMRVNLDGSRNVFSAARALGTCPIVVFSSTLAVYGGEMPDPIEDWFMTNPQNSYGAAKAIGELLLTDMSRKGFIDGRGPRLPTISIRPGKPNAAASSFMSSIFREPLQGKEAQCPVGPDYMHYYLSPKRCVENLIHAAEIDGAALGMNRCFVLPGRTHRLGDMVESMRKIAGDAPCNLINWERDPQIEAIVLKWVAHLNPAKAVSLGFKNDESFEDNLRFFLEDDIER